MRPLTRLMLLLSLLVLIPDTGYDNLITNPSTPDILYRGWSYDVVDRWIVYSGVGGLDEYLRTRYERYIQTRVTSLSSIFFSHSGLLYDRGEIT